MALESTNFGKNRGPRGQQSIVQFNELREPVVFFRSTRSPGEGVSLVRTLQKYHNAFAKVTFGEKKMLGGENADNKPTHYFFVRNQLPQEVEGRDYIAWGNKLYAVVSTRIIDERRQWLRISTKESEQFDSASYSGEGAPSSVEPGTLPAEPPPSTTNPYW